MQSGGGCQLQGYLRLYSRSLWRDDLFGHGSDEWSGIRIYDVRNLNKMIM